MRDREYYKASKKVYENQGALAFNLDVFGDEIAKREGYKELNGIDAIYFYLVHKFKWQPSVVRGMSFEDIRFVLTEELSGWTLPKEARGLEDL